jgi:hypothetical protein
MEAGICYQKARNRMQESLIALKGNRHRERSTISGFFGRMENSSYIIIKSENGQFEEKIMLTDRRRL